MYPENSGYRYETGGLMSCLRSLEAEKSKRLGFLVHLTPIVNDFSINHSSH